MKPAYRIGWLILPVLLLTGCKWPEWVGRYKSENCTTLEYVEFFPDKTADVKFFGAPFAVNKPMKKDGNRFTIETKDSRGTVIERYVFEYSNGSFREVSGMEWGCVMKK